MYSGCLLVSSHPHILISLRSCILGACWYLRILTSSYPYVHVLWVLASILASSHPQVPVSYLFRKLESDKIMVLTKKPALYGNKSWLLQIFNKMVHLWWKLIPSCEVITTAAGNLTVILSSSYFHITREPYLASIRQVKMTTSADKVDIILCSFTRLSFFCSHVILHLFTVDLFCILYSYSSV